MLHVDENRLMRENPFYYCEAWLPGTVESCARARIGGFRNFYDPNYQTKLTIRSAIAKQILPPNSIFEVPRGEVLVRLTTYHLCPAKYRIPANMCVSPDLFLGATWSNSKDVDNISKIYLDALNPRRKPNPLEGLLWHDDVQCTWLNPVKMVVFDRSQIGVYFQAWYRMDPMIETLSEYMKGYRHGDTQTVWSSS
jgi:Holliday junction resolvase RusA-like endonuclease